MSDKRHYYLFWYSFGSGTGSIWFGFPKKNITQSYLADVKEKASKSLPAEFKVIVMGASYLGYMTQEEFMDEGIN